MSSGVSADGVTSSDSSAVGFFLHQTIVIVSASENQLSIDLRLEQQNVKELKLNSEYFPNALHTVNFNPAFQYQSSLWV